MNFPVMVMDQDSFMAFREGGGMGASTSWINNMAFWYPGTNSVKTNWSGVGSASWTAIATPLVDSDGDGIYDLDDIHPGFDDNSLENI